MADFENGNSKFADFVESYSDGALAEFNAVNKIETEAEEPKQCVKSEFFLTVLRPKILEIIGKRRPEFKVNTLRMIGEHSGRLWSAKAKLSQSFVAIMLGIGVKSAKALLEELVKLNILQVVKSYTRLTKRPRVYGFSTAFRESILEAVYAKGKGMRAKPTEEKIEWIRKCDSSIESSTFASGCFENQDYTGMVEAALQVFDTSVTQRRFICRTIGHKVFMQTKDKDTAKRAYARVSAAIRRSEPCSWASKLKERQ